jgi:hypothetical protein
MKTTILAEVHCWHDNSEASRSGRLHRQGVGSPAGERALIYTSPNHKAPTKPYQKGISVSEWVQAFEQLTNAGDFSRSWFERFMPACAKEGGCNFTTIGGIFELLGYAAYDRGTYRITGS